MKIIISIIAVIIAGLIFAGAYLLNHKTPKPEGCENLSDCSSCNNMNCSVKAKGEK